MGAPPLKLKAFTPLAQGVFTAAGARLRRATSPRALLDPRRLDELKDALKRSIKAHAASAGRVESYVTLDAGSRKRRRE